MLLELFDLKSRDAPKNDADRGYAQDVCVERRDYIAAEEIRYRMAQTVPGALDSPDVVWPEYREVEIGFGVAESEHDEGCDPDRGFAVYIAEQRPHNLNPQNHD